MTVKGGVVEEVYGQEAAKLKVHTLGHKIPKKSPSRHMTVLSHLSR